MLDLHCYVGFSLVVASRGCSLVAVSGSCFVIAVCRLVIVVASLVAEHRL